MTASSKLIRSLYIIFLGLITFGIALTLQMVIHGASYPKWIPATLIVVPLVLFRVLFVMHQRVQPPSPETIAHAFDDVYEQKLRSIVITFPKAWKYRKLGRGLHTFLVSECGFKAAISIELVYLDETEITTIGGYSVYAEEFVRGRHSKMLFNRRTKRWGLSAHEFGDESDRTAGQRVTLPYHGTEYGFQLRLDDVALAPAARKLFELFLDRIKVEPPELHPHTAFDGRLRLALPKGFVAESGGDHNRQVWRAIDRQNCSITMTQCPFAHEGLSVNLLRPLLAGCPRPQQANDELDGKRILHFEENGFGGYIYYQASDTWGWFAAVGDLPTGGRYIFCLNDKNPTQEPYYGVYHYQQIAYEILVTLNERV